jgi:hypothetical protein
VAPLAASGAAVPVLVDLALGEFPGVPAMVGVLVVGAGIVVTTLASSREPTRAPAPPCRGAMRPHRGRAPAIGRPPRSILLALVTAVLFGAFFLVVDRGSAAAGDGVLWVTLGIQLGALPITLLAALSAGGLRVGQPAVLLPVGVLRALNLAGDASLSYAVTGAELAVVSVLPLRGPGGDHPAGAGLHGRAPDRAAGRRGRSGRSRNARRRIGSLSVEVWRTGEAGKWSCGRCPPRWGTSG